MNSSEKEALLQVLLKQRAKECEDSFYLFVLDAFEATHNGEALQSNWHIKFLCDRVQKEVERISRKENRDRHLIINVPPRSLKSEVISMFLSAWCWVKDPSIKFISSSYSLNLSIDHNVKSRRLLDTRFFQMHWGHKFKYTGDQNTKTQFENDKGGLRTCTSTGGTITGKGCDILVIDDPVNPQQAESEASRLAANTFFDQTLTTRLNRPEIGIFIVVMQRLHEDDLTGHLLHKDPDNWEHICIPAELTADVSPVELRDKYEDGLFFTERFNRKYLKQLRSALGSYGYAGQILQSPAPDGGGLLKAEYFGEFDMNELPDTVNWFYCIDPAYTSNEANDPSGLCSFCFYKNNFYFRDISEVWLEFPDLMKYINKYTKSNGYSRRSMIYVEPKASGKSVVQTLKNSTGLNVREDKPPTKDKVARVKDIVPIAESGRVFLLKGSNWKEKFIHQASQFPNGKHDDMVDVVVMAIDKFANRRPKRMLLS